MHRKIPPVDHLRLAGGALGLGAAFLSASLCAAQVQPLREGRPPAEPNAASSAVQDRYLFRIALPLDDAPPSEASSAPGSEEGADRRGAQVSGRLILFLVPDEPRFLGADPAAGPHLDHRAVVASLPIDAGVDLGGEIVLVTGSPRGDSATAGLVATHPLAELSGRWRAQAVLDLDARVAGHLGPGNLVSTAVDVDLSSDRFDEVRLELTERIDPLRLPEAPGVALVRHPSALLRSHRARAGRADSPGEIEALVVFPAGYDDLSFPRRRWPTIYSIGDSKADWLDAFELARIMRTPEGRAALPQAVWVHLDTGTPWGHGGISDSDTAGPRMRALVEEFIPHLEERFRLIALPDARVLIGHGHGGWSAVELALDAPDVFGAAFASAPTYLDLEALAGRNLYAEPNLFTDAAGNEIPALRAILGPDDDLIRLTVREEAALEGALDPSGRSGLFWQSLAAMWSPFDAARRAPAPLFDEATGEIDLVVAESWASRDIARRFMREPARIGPLLAERVRIVCGVRDDRARHLAASLLKARVEAWLARERLAGRRDLPARVAIDLLDGLDEEATRVHARLRFHREITEFLRARGHAEAPALGSGPSGASATRRPSPARRPEPSR